MYASSAATGDGTCEARVDFQWIYASTSGFAYSSEARSRGGQWLGEKGY